MNLGEKIYTLRTQKNLSQGDLAEILDVSRQSISKWETNSSVPELDKLTKLCDIFGITMDDLTSYEVTMTKPAPITTTLTHSEIVGYILLIAGLFAGILCFVNNYTHYLYTLALPILLCSVVCLKVKENTLYVCSWIIGNALCSQQAVRHGYTAFDFVSYGILLVAMYFYTVKICDVSRPEKRTDIKKVCALFVADLSILAGAISFLNFDAFCKITEEYTRSGKYNYLMHILTYSGGTVQYMIQMILLTIASYLFYLTVCHINANKNENTPV